MKWKTQTETETEYREQGTDNGQNRHKATNVEYIAKCKTQRKQTKWNNQTKVALAKHHKTNRYETKLNKNQNKNKNKSKTKICKTKNKAYSKQIKIKE